MEKAATETTILLCSRMKEFEKNVLPHLHNYRYLQLLSTIETHRQQHAFDLAHSSKAAEKRQETSHARGDH